MSVFIHEQSERFLVQTHIPGTVASGRASGLKGAAEKAATFAI